MKQKYLADVIGEDYREFENNIAVIQAPTGAGKSTFTIQELVPYFVDRNKRYRCHKALVVVNRTTLKKQYEKDFYTVYPKHVDMENAVIIKTYQQLSKEIEGYKDVALLFAEFNLVVCDEAHFFYADSDFNTDAYLLLHAIMYAAAKKTLVFMSATVEEVLPLIEESWQHCVMNYSRNYTSDNEVCQLYKRKFIVLDHLIGPDFSRFRCRYISNLEDLATVYATSEGKSILFVDDKRKADEFAELLLDKGLKSSEIKKLNADIMDRKETQIYIESLLCTHILPSKVLITTSVLDNGVSIIDDDIENICIVTYSKISFLQMLGRTRATGKQINLIFLKPNQTDISTRFNALQQEMELIDRHRLNDQSSAEWHSDLHRGGFIKTGWALENSLEGRLYRKLFVVCLNNPNYLRRDSERSIRCPYVPYGHDTCFVLNKAALKKINDSYDTLYELNELVGKDEILVVGYQMGWINHDLAELDLEFLDAQNTSAEKRKKKMVNELLQIQKFSNKDFVERKKQLTEKYFKKMYSNIDFRGGNNGCGTDKFKMILEDVGLCLVEIQQAAKKYYTVRRKE